LEQISPHHVAAYIEQLQQNFAAPSVKQHLAALRMLFDYLVIGQILPANPASAVRGPKYVVSKGLTAVLTPDEAHTLFAAIDISSITGLRDRALLGAMVYSFARVGAVVAMNTEDYFAQGKRYWFRLHEKGGRLHDVPVHHKADEFMDAYLAAAGISGQKGAPLFRTIDRRRSLTDRRIHRVDVLAMVKRRTRDAGLLTATCCHSFRATGITCYLLNGGRLDEDQPYCLLCARVFSLGKAKRFNDLRAFRELRRAALGRRFHRRDALSGIGVDETQSRQANRPSRVKTYVNVGRWHCGQRAASSASVRGSQTNSRGSKFPWSVRTIA
ncbi:MAG: tyrosine-type recombinase/integrase, partial [Planctomycetes bacterium]|nr:tyrosine-type recombinase/integrase [Planctomycetota bacterium]